MTKYLFISVQAAKRPSVTQFLARLILIFAFVVCTLHTPALAHVEPSRHHADHGETSAPGALADDSDAPKSSRDAGDSVHHHHCPAAVAARTVDMAHALIAEGLLLPVHRAAALSSFSHAPPTEPPAA